MSVKQAALQYRSCLVAKTLKVVLSHPIAISCVLHCNDPGALEPCHVQQTEKVVAVLPFGGAAAKEPRYANCVENALNLRPFLAGKADLVVTADKEGKNSGERSYLPQNP